MDFLRRELTSAVLCWRMERRDGAAIGFTAHDRDIVREGIVYRAAPGMLPSAISQSDGFAADGLEIEGALTDAAIAEADLAAGRWDGASVFLFLIDWQEPEGEPLPIARGVLGDVAMRGGGFEAELKGPAAALDRPVVEQTSPECRATLGDRRCRVDMAGRARITRIVAVEGEDAVRVASTVPGNAHGYGRLRWIGGANSGLESAILSSAGALVRLREPPHYRPAIGDAVELTEGCDKALATCAGRFGNAVNFRGEPHLPGMDLLTRYAGG